MTKKNEALTWPELLERIDELRHEIAHLCAGADPSGPPDGAVEEPEALKKK